MVSLRLELRDLVIDWWVQAAMRRMILSLANYEMDENRDKQT